MTTKTAVSALTLALGIAASARHASAQDVVAGWEGGDSSGYAFVSPSARIPVTMTQAVLLRATASYLYYNSQADGPTDVMAPGAAAAAGYRFAGSRVNLAVLGGFERRRVEGTWEQGAAGSVELFVASTRLTQISALGTYAQAHRYSWSRVGLKRQFTNTAFTGSRTLSAGVEASAQGNVDVTSYQLGGVLEHAWLRSGMSIQVRGGLSTSRYAAGPDKGRPYIGVGIYRRL
jgi:hypothetical protein